MLLRGILDLLFWSVSKGGYGALVGLIVGAVSAVAVMFLPAYLETGVLCESEVTCNDLRGWLIMLAVFGACLGAILGTMLGIVGKKFAPTILGPDRERAGSIVGGFIGGIALWLILLILSSTSGDN